MLKVGMYRVELELTPSVRRDRISGTAKDTDPNTTWQGHPSSITAAGE
jgi:hypothetical protein